MKTIILAAIRYSLMFSAVAAVSLVHPAQAYTVTLKEVGSNVVANGSGPINLTGLTSAGQNEVLPGLSGALGIIQTGPDPSQVDRYIGFTGPTSFGLGFFFEANSASGDFVGIRNSERPISGLLVPQGYSSGNPLSSSATWNNATFASLGVTPGTYVWTWGTGLANQNFTLIIEGAGVPDGGSTVSLLGFASLGLVALRRKLGC